MTVKPNGTHAKELALRFHELTQTRTTSHMVGKSINQAKNLLSSGYTKEEILEVMEYVILEKHFDVYSFGYFSTCMNDVLRELTKRKEEALAKSRKTEIQEAVQQQLQQAQAEEVVTDDESTRRNQEKARRLQSNIQSGFREKFALDMFEEQRQDT